MFLNGRTRVVLRGWKREVMKKITLLAAMAAMMLLTAIPAFANDETNVGNVSVGNPSGSNVNACPAVITQTDNEQDVIQFISGDQAVDVDVRGIGAEAEDVRIESTFEASGFNPEASAACHISVWW